MIRLSVWYGWHDIAESSVSGRPRFFFVFFFVLFFFLWVWGICAVSTTCSTKIIPQDSSADKAADVRAVRQTVIDEPAYGRNQLINQLINQVLYYRESIKRFVITRQKNCLLAIWTDSQKAIVSGPIQNYAYIWVIYYQQGSRIKKTNKKRQNELRMKHTKQCKHPRELQLHD